jgi:predicted PurR-regulated permease PerM
VQRAPGTTGTAAGTIVEALSSVAAGALSLLTVVILTFYLLVESDTIFAGFARLFPRDRRPAVIRVSRAVSEKVSAWLAGQLMLAGVIGGSSAIGLYLIGVPYFYVLALVSAVGEMIPVVGPILAAIPAIAVAFTVSTKMVVWVVVFFVAQQQAENHLLVPNIMQRQVGVTAVTVIVALLVGGSLLGIMGAVLAVPTAAILQAIVQELLDERDRQAG